MSVSFVFLFLIQPLLGIVAKILFSMWLYKDAKKKDIQPVWWIIGVIFISWIALVIYLIYSKDKPEGAICPVCNTYNFHNGNFCVNCGNTVTHVPKSNDKGLLYGGIIVFVISIIIGTIAAVLGFFIYTGVSDSYYFEDYYYRRSYIEPFSNSYYEGISSYNLIEDQNSYKSVNNIKL